MVGGIFTMMDISSSALRAERARMNMHANNLANAQTTHDADGNISPYRKKRMYFKTGNPAMTGSETLGVDVDRIEDDYRTDFVKKYEPGHPDADAEGNVLYPNVQVEIEMVDMMVAARAYEANLAAMDAAKQMFNGALAIIA